MPQICKACGLWKCPGCQKCKTADEYHKKSETKSRNKLRPRCKTCTLVVSEDEKKRRREALKKYRSSKKYIKKQQTTEAKIKHHLYYLRYKENGGREKRSQYHRLERVKKQHNAIVRQQYGTMKHKIRVAVNRAVKRCSLINPKMLNCCYCGKEAQQYHHPLEYRWKIRFCVIPVCTACHGRVHSKYAMQRPHLVGFGAD